MRSLPTRTVPSQRATWAQPAEGRPGPSDYNGHDGHDDNNGHDDDDDNGHDDCHCDCDHDVYDVSVLMITMLCHDAGDDLVLNLGFTASKTLSKNHDNDGDREDDEEEDGDDFSESRLNCPEDSDRRTTPDPTDCSRSYMLMIFSKSILSQLIVVIITVCHQNHWCLSKSLICLLSSGS